MNKTIMGNFFWRIPFWVFLLQVSWPAEISFADHRLLRYHMIAAWGLKGSVNEELCRGPWLRSRRLVFLALHWFWSRFIMVKCNRLKKNLQTSNWKPLSPEDPSVMSPCSWEDEAVNLGLSLARRCFQQGGQPTWWCRSPWSSRLLLTLRWCFPPVPHDGAAGGIGAESHSAP